jgi:hypothetical protein
MTDATPFVAIVGAFCLIVFFFALKKKKNVENYSCV